MKGIDTTHPVWIKIRRGINDRITDLSKRLESPMGPDETNNVRGRIAELRKILRDVEPETTEHQPTGPLY